MRSQRQIPLLIKNPEVANCGLKSLRSQSVTSKIGIFSIANFRLISYKWAMKKSKAPAVIDSIENRIYVIRGQKVMLDSDLAIIYGVETKVLLQAMKRNSDRFPSDFLFRLTQEEYEFLRSQFVTSKKNGRGGRRYIPYVFTEHGAVMLASVLNSPRAIEASIFVVRAFIRFRELLSSHRELAVKLKQLESKIAVHDREIKALFEAIRQLMKPPEKSKRQIGFKK